MQIHKYFRSLNLVLLLCLPLFMGSSNYQYSSNQFSLINLTQFSPGDDVSVVIYINNKGSRSFSLKLLKVTDPIGFYTLAKVNRYRYDFDIIGLDDASKYLKLIKEWEIEFTAYTQGNRKDVQVGKINEPGLYILQAVSNEQVAYCPVVVSRFGIIHKTKEGEVLTFLSDAKTSEFQSNIKFSVYKNDKFIESKMTGEDGIAFFNFSEDSIPGNNNYILFADNGEEVLISNPYIYFDNYNKYIGYVYTNQPVYRPGQEAFFKAIIRKTSGNSYENLPGQRVKVEINSPRGNKIYSEYLSTNESGTINGSVMLGEDADLGHYSINIKLDGNEWAYINGSFSVEEYKKPEYSIEIETDKPNYLPGEKIAGTVKANYYFGSPVKNGKVTVQIYKQLYWMPWWYFSDYGWFYQNFYSDRSVPWGGGNEMVHQVSGELNSDGEFKFDYKLDNILETDYVYSVKAKVTDYSRREISGEKTVKAMRGEFSLFTSPEKYFIEKGKPIKLRVNVLDFEGKPKAADFKIYIKYPDENSKQNDDNYDFALNGSTGEDGKAVVTYLPDFYKEGYYRYKVVAEDFKGRVIAASSTFFVGDRNSYYHYRTSAGLEIVTDKDAYEVNDSLIAYVFLPSPKTELLLTFEAGEIISYKKIKADEASFTINEKLTEKFSPSFNIAVSFLKEGQLYHTQKMIGVLSKDKFLNISLKSSKDKYKPKEEAKYLIEVTDNKGKPVKDAELSVGVIDESIYAIQEERLQNITSFFYQPRYSYSNVQTSLRNNNYSYSRKLLALDNNIFNDNESSKGNLRFYGRVINKIDSAAGIGNALLMLESDKYFYKTVTDSNGNFEFKNIKPGFYSIYINDINNAVETIDIKNDMSLNLFISVESVSQMAIRESGGEAAYMVDGITASKVSLQAGIARSDYAEAQSGIAYAEADLRSNFVDAAFWNPTVVTNSKGEAEVSFKVPDNLTSWRATVRGATKDTKIGEAKDNFITRKDLLVRMETPRFFREGDEITISTIIHNYLKEDKRTKISFDPGNLTLIDSDINTPGYSTVMFNQNEKMFELKIKENSELRIDWRLKVHHPLGEAVLKAEALTDEESDAVELKVPVLPKGVEEIVPVVSNFTGDGDELGFTIPQNIDLRTAQFNFNINPSLAGIMLKSLDDLVGYPYGCVEQTMSRFLPTIIVSNTLREINAPFDSAKFAELPLMVKKGLERLYNFQNESGGWGWWHNDEGNAYMTAYVMYGLSLAKKSGYEIDRQVYEKGINRLTSLVRAKENPDFTSFAFMVYALSVEKESHLGDLSGLIISSAKKILIEQSTNSSYTNSLALLALLNVDHKPEEKYWKHLISQAKDKGTFAYWGDESNYSFRWQDDNVQATAFAVKALVHYKPELDVIDKAVKYLLQKRKGYSWRSTQETAAIIFSLTDYMKVSNELRPEYSAEVYLNGKKIFDKSFSEKDAFTEGETISISGLKNDHLKKGDNRLQIVKKGKGKVYFSGLNKYFTPAEENVYSHKSFKVRREYFLLRQVERNNRIIYRKDEISGSLKPGDEILVKTFVETDNAGFQYFILEDMLPSGFEAVKDNNQYAIADENYYPEGNHIRHRPWRWWYADREYRDEKVAFFVTYTQPKMEFSYIIKAQIPGKFSAMPAQAYLMYFPEVRGKSNAYDVAVKE